MDEVFVMVVVDILGRFYLVFDVDFKLLKFGDMIF